MPLDPRGLEAFRIPSPDEAVEVLAEVEHDQWVEWSKTIVQQEKISEERTERWARYWRPYAELSADVQEHDRVWARRALAALERYGYVIVPAVGIDHVIRDGIRRLVESPEPPPCNHAGIGLPGCPTCDPRVAT